MARITIANFATIADAITGQAGELQTALGNMKTFDTANTDAYDGADKVTNFVLGLDDYEQEKSLLDHANGVSNKFGSAAMFYRVSFDNLINSLDQHTGGIDQYLTDNSATVSQTFADVCAACGVTISASNIA